MDNYKIWLYNRAKEMRNAPTAAEKKVMKYFNQHNVYYKFQAPILISEDKGYIADFLLGNVILEIDGGIHSTEEAKAKDKQRTKELESKGYKVIRMKNTSTSKGQIGKVLTNRFKNELPQVADRIQKTPSKKHKVKLSNSEFRERIWSVSGGHYKNYV